MIWLLPHPRPLPRQQVVSLSQSYCGSPVELTDGRRGGAKSYDGEKAWSPINHSILSHTDPSFSIVQWLILPHPSICSSNTVFSEKRSASAFKKFWIMDTGKMISKCPSVKIHFTLVCYLQAYLAPDMFGHITRKFRSQLPEATEFKEFEEQLYRKKNISRYPVQ